MGSELQHYNVLSTLGANKLESLIYSTNPSWVPTARKALFQVLGMHLATELATSCLQGSHIHSSGEDRKTNNSVNIQYYIRQWYLLCRKINDVKGKRMRAITILDGVPRQDHKEEVIFEHRTDWSEEGNHADCWDTAFQVDERARAKARMQEYAGSVWGPLRLHHWSDAEWGNGDKNWGWRSCQRPDVAESEQNFEFYSQCVGKSLEIWAALWHDVICFF